MRSVSEKLITVVLDYGNGLRGMHERRPEVHYDLLHQEYLDMMGRAEFLALNLERTVASRSLATFMGSTGMYGSADEVVWDHPALRVNISLNPLQFGGN